MRKVVAQGSLIGAYSSEIQLRQARVPVSRLIAVESESYVPLIGTPFSIPG